MIQISLPIYIINGHMLNTAKWVKRQGEYFRFDAEIYHVQNISLTIQIAKNYQPLTQLKIDAIYMPFLPPYPSVQKEPVS